MLNKIEKINELNTLFNDGIITKDEFEVLKKDLFNNQIDKESNDKKEKSKKIKSNTSNSEKIILKSFQNKSKLIDKPNVEYLNFIDIDKKDETLLKPFIRLKHISSPMEMTNDEKKILIKLFSQLEIEQLNAEREGYNFPLFSICSVLSAVFAIFLIKISPCLMYLGGIPLTANSAIMSIYVLSRISATKSDKIASAVAIILVVFGFVFFGITWKEAMAN